MIQTGPGRRRVPRSSVVIGSGAATVALWLGLTAPNVSPVAPPPPIVAEVAPAPAAAPNAGTSVVPGAGPGGIQP